MRTQRASVRGGHAVPHMHTCSLCVVAVATTDTPWVWSLAPAATSGGSSSAVVLDLPPPLLLLTAAALLAAVAACWRVYVPPPTRLWSDAAAAPPARACPASAASVTPRPLAAAAVAAAVAAALAPVPTACRPVAGARFLRRLRSPPIWCGDRRAVGCKGRPLTEPLLNPDRFIPVPMGLPVLATAAPPAPGGMLPLWPVSPWH